MFVEPYLNWTVPVVTGVPAASTDAVNRTRSPSTDVASDVVIVTDVGVPDPVTVNVNGFDHGPAGSLATRSTRFPGVVAMPATDVLIVIVVSFTRVTPLVRIAIRLPPRTGSRNRFRSG